tara:strand:+ start:301 stop:897 length:597 start_codon:yes stop_codon:yes gene_type:complete
MLRIIIILFSIGILNSCTGIVGGKYEENLAKLDKVYGYCDNPQRNLKKSSLRYKNCKRKEMAAGPDGVVDEESSMPFDDLFNKKGESNSSMVMANVNKHLWVGSITTLNKYSLKIADSMGGYLETDWIYTEDIKDERCAIKIQVLSTELISNGIDVNFVCAQLKNGNWIISNERFEEEEKSLHLKILKEAQKSYQSNL